MRIFVTVKPRAKKSEVIAVDETHLVVSTNTPPVDGKANEAVIRLLAKYLGRAPSGIALISGKTGKNKVFEI